MSGTKKNAEKQARRSGKWIADRPYNALPPLPPATELETRKVLKSCITARAALAELKQAAERIPDPSVLIKTLPLLESQASSEIENIVTTTDQLFQQRELGDSPDPATKEALRYSEALLEGFRSLADRPLMTSTAEAICSEIKGREMRVRQVPGTALARSSGNIVYTPPEGEKRLRDLLANWEKFMHHAGELDPLVRLAVGHYQFEAIHPFTDGNGRTGRVINSLFLISEGLLSLPILYLSRYLIQERDNYYRLLLKVTQQETWEEWLLFMIAGVEQTARWTRKKIEAMCSLLETTTAYAREELGRGYSYELITLLFELPYCRIANVMERENVIRQTASTSLKKLTKIGILEEITRGREKLFVHKKLLRLLTEDGNEFAPYN